MIPIFLDYETFWSDTHSLTKMPAFEYVMHKDTDIISVSYKVGLLGQTQIAFGEQDVKAALIKLPWDDAIAIGHNMSGFDSMLLQWRCGIKPKMWGCTAAMARPKYAKVCGVSLAALCKYLGIGEKDNRILLQTKGKRLDDFTEDEILKMVAYNISDTDNCAKLFHRLYRDTPAQEMRLIDMTTRMLVDSKFELDYDLIRRTRVNVAREKQEALIQLHDKLSTLGGWTPDEVQADDIETQMRYAMASSAKFAQVLEKIGVPVPMKASPTNPEKLIPALSKSDEGMQELLGHENPLVVEAARCRLQVKSTLLETRLEALERAATACSGIVPVPLRYCGADTTGRWSGEHYNLQNLPRIPRDKDGNIIFKSTNALRMSLRAPKGYKVIVADLSGIELRVNMFLWKVPYAMQLFMNDPAKADLYKYFAANHLFNVEESAVTKDQRQAGKVAHLGLGFGAGGRTYQRVAKLMGNIDLELSESEETVRIYRQAHPEIVNGWHTIQSCIPQMFNGFERAIDPWELCWTEKEAIRLPSGRRIHYPSLRTERNETTGKVEYLYGEGRHKARIYGPKGDENIVQALARDVVAEHAIKFHARTGLAPALTVHDELVYVVKEEDAVDLLAQLQSIMRKGVSWWPELITWSEGDIADSYGEAK